MPHNLCVYTNFFVLGADPAKFFIIDQSIRQSGP